MPTFRPGSFARRTLKVTAISVVARGTGFLIPFFIAGWFGVSDQTDVLFFVYALALFVSNVLAPVMENLSVPFIAQRRERGRDVPPFVAALALVALSGAIVASVALGILLVPLLSRITAFSPSDLDLASTLLLQIAPLAALTVLSSVFVGALNSAGHFYTAAASPLVRAAVNLIIIYALKSTFGVSAVVIGYVAGEAIRALLLFAYSISRNLVSFAFHGSGLGQDVLEFLKVAGFQAAGMLSIGFVPLIDKTMASWLGRGSVSLLEYADRLYTIPVTLLSTGLVVTSLAHWSDLLYSQGRSALSENVRKVTAKVTWICVALSLGFGVAAPLVVRVVYHRLSAGESHVVLFALLAFLIGVTPFVVGQLYNRALLALKQTRFLLLITVVANISNVLFNLVFMHALGVAGLALSSSATSLAVVFVLKRRFDTLASDVTSPVSTTAEAVEA